MEIKFDSLNNFEQALKEVEVLLDVAKENETNNERYLTYNKANLLLLVAKCENFIEQTAEEYIDIINGMKIPAHFIPDLLKVYHSLYIIDKSKNIFENQHKIEEVKKIFFELGALWHSSEIFTSLAIGTKFNYGKHGEKELIKLFSTIGINNVFEEIKVYEQEETLLGKDENEIDFKGIFNSITNIRNNIIHQDVTPNLTHIDIEKYKQYLKQFASKLIEHLISNLYKIQQTLSCSSEIQGFKEAAAIINKDI